MIRPFTDEKIVFDPEEEQFYLVSQGVLGSPRPFRQVKKIYKDGDVFSVDEDRVIECTLSQAGQRFGVGSILSDIGADNSQLGFTKFEDLPQEVRSQAIDRARKWCVGILESTEVQDMTQEELDERLDELLNELEEEVESDVEDIKGDGEGLESLTPDEVEDAD